MLRDIARRHAITSLLSLGAIGIAGLAAAGEADEPRLAVLQQQLTQVQAQLQQLAQENRSLREGQHQLERRLAELAGAPGAVPVAGAPTAEASPALPASPSALPGPAAGEGPRLWGYGEVYFADPTRDGRRREADLARGVVGLGYSFDERTEFNSEFEVEHAVASASDVGEFEVEQFYVDRRLGDSVSARGGLFLMPFGLLNEHHEPTRYYGVQRNFVETLIIPSTWREGGVSLRGDTPLGLGCRAARSPDHAVGGARALDAWQARPVGALRAGLDQRPRGRQRGASGGCEPGAVVLLRILPAVRLRALRAGRLPRGGLRALRALQPRRELLRDGRPGGPDGTRAALGQPRGPRLLAGQR